MKTTTLHMKTAAFHMKIADFHVNRKLSFSVSLHVEVSHSILDSHNCTLHHLTPLTLIFGSLAHSPLFTQFFSHIFVRIIWAPLYLIPDTFNLSKTRIRKSKNKIIYSSFLANSWLNLFKFLLSAIHKD